MRIGLISLAMIECQSDNQIVYDIKSWLGLQKIVLLWQAGYS